MRRIGSLVAGIGVILLLTAAAPALANGGHAYVGSQKCKMCHNSDAKGAQFKHWEASPHSKAFVTLGGEKAKEVAKAKGIADPQKASECLQCHVTGYGAPAEMLTDKYNAQEGVGCESCHGPGGDYWKLNIMKDREQSVANGLVIPNEATCLNCHNEKNPTHKGFDFATMFPKIQHPNPQKAAAK